jgi:hypothetical protein
LSRTYPVSDLSATSGFALESRATVDPEELASQLKDIGKAIAPVLTEDRDPGSLGIKSIEIALSIGVEGGVWFVAKGSTEASIKLTLERPLAMQDRT